MKVSYVTKPIFDGKHASLHIPDEVLEQLGAKRVDKVLAPLGAL